MKYFVTAIFVCLGSSGAVNANDYNYHAHTSFWGGVKLNGLAVEEDVRSLDAEVSLATIPYVPKLSYKRQAYEYRDSFDGWRSGGAHSLTAHLPYGLTLEAGHRIDGFGDRTSDFVGLTFTYSNLKDHYNNMYHGKISATQETAQKRRNKGGRLWSIVAPLALGLAVGELMADDSPRTRLASTANTAPGTGNTNNNPPAGNGDNSGSPSSQWNMVWNDEFNGNALDTSMWSSTDSYGRDQCFGGGNNEQQCYTSHESASQNITFSNGKLVLTARQATGLGWGRTYTSGRIQSNGKGDFTYGRFEASIKLPTGQGSWPAFWMLPSINSVDWPSRGEIDIMEAINLGGSGNGTIHGTAHFGDPHTYLGGSDIISDVNAFNTYAVEWYPDEIRWFLNGNQYYQLSQDRWFSSDAPGDTNAPFDQNFHLILNFAVGGQWPGNSDGQNFPRQMEVDYVRVYECPGNDYSACKQ